MKDMADAIPLLVLRARGLAMTLDAFVVSERRYGGEGPPLSERRKALVLAASSRALSAALLLAADNDDILTAANELTDLEEAAEHLLMRERDTAAEGVTVAPDPDTVRPPPSESGTFAIERKKASTNRLLAVRG